MPTISMFYGIVKEAPMEFVTHVQVCDDFHLKLKFNTGETRIFDARPYLDKGVFRQLKGAWPCLR